MASYDHLTTFACNFEMQKHFSSVNNMKKNKTEFELYNYMILSIETNCSHEYKNSTVLQLNYQDSFNSFQCSS
jgi:hypothetical protein